ncbi:MAG: CRTAC1 family protein, partial [Planctomycetaceae bacterium]
FTDVTIETGLAEQAGKGLGLACRDFNADGRMDFYVANDMEANRLWIQQPDGTFQDEALLRGVAFNALGDAEAGMGVASGDFDANGRFDLFLTHLSGETNTLYLALEDGAFTDGTARSDLGLPSLPWTGFGVAAFDLEHDGDLDLAVVNGRVKRGVPLPQTRLEGFWSDYAEPNQIYLNDGRGRFTDESGRAGRFCELFEVSRGLASGDIDNDGDVDLLLTNCGGPARLFRNAAPKRGNWLLVRLIDPVMNRDAVGALVTVRAGDRELLRECGTAAGYLTANDPRLHFGLGQVERYDGIEVRWPDGRRESFPGGAAGRALTLRRGEGRHQTRDATP